MVNEQGELAIGSEDDLVAARTTIREIATEIGFGMTDTTRIVTAVSELARNIYLYADSGVMRWQTVTDGRKTTLEITFDDEGPGIPDVDTALQEGHSTSEGMGHGLSGTRKLMDEFEINSVVESGTTVTIRKHRLES